MSYIVLVLCHNDVNYIKSFESKYEAEEEAIVLANEWYNKDGILEFTPHQIETIEEMRSYYQSELISTVKTMFMLLWKKLYYLVKKFSPFPQAASDK